jgi:glycosyltransferase involved in cell wall biosynthesis
MAETGLPGVKLLKLTVIIPAYNEAPTIATLLDRVARIPYDKEIIVVDDWSTDGTRDILRGLEMPDLRVLFHDRNMGKGAVVRTGLREATGDAVVIQDADLEYDPADCTALLKCMEREAAVAVYGSRFKGGGEFLLKSRFANRLLTALTNILFNARISDMETCYKLIRMEVIRTFELRSSGFEIEPEITAKLLKRGHRISEVPVSYRGRSSLEGKKIHWRDFFRAILALLYYRLNE